MGSRLPVSDATEHAEPTGLLPLQSLTKSCLSGRACDQSSASLKLAFQEAWRQASTLQGGRQVCLSTRSISLFPTGIHDVDTSSEKGCTLIESRVPVECTACKKAPISGRSDYFCRKKEKNKQLPSPRPRGFAHEHTPTVMHAIHVHGRWGGSNTDVSGTIVDFTGPSNPAATAFVMIAQQCEGPPGQRSRLKQDLIMRCLGATQRAASTRPRGVCQWACLQIPPINDKPQPTAS